MNDGQSRHVCHQENMQQPKDCLSWNCSLQLLLEADARNGVLVNLYSSFTAASDCVTREATSRMNETLLTVQRVENIVKREIRFLEDKGRMGVKLQLFCHYLSTIAPSSTECESVFSAANQICTKIWYSSNNNTTFQHAYNVLCLEYLFLINVLPEYMLLYYIVTKL